MLWDNPLMISSQFKGCTQMSVLLKHNVTKVLMKRCDASDGMANNSGLEGPGFKPWPSQEK